MYAMEFKPVDKDIIPMMNHSTHGSELLAQLNAEESLNRLPLLLVLAILTFVGTIANAHVLFVFGTKIKRSTYRVFVLALGCIDMLGCTISIPFQIIDETHPYTFHNAIPCKIFRFFDTNLAIAAALMLVVIASERFRKICRPNGKQMTEKRAIRSIIAVIIGSSVATSPALLIYGRHTVVIEPENMNGTECSWSDVVSDSYYGYVYYAVELFIVMSCMVSITVLYSLVGRALRAHHERMQSTKIVKFHYGKSKKSSSSFRKPKDSTTEQEFPNRESVESMRTDRDSGVDSSGPASSDSQESNEIEIQFRDSSKDTEMSEEDNVFTITNTSTDKNDDHKEGTSSTCQLCEGDDSSRKSSSISRFFARVSHLPETLKGLLLNKRGTSEGAGVIPDIVVTDCSDNVIKIISTSKGRSKIDVLKQQPENETDLSVGREDSKRTDKHSLYTATKRLKKPLKKMFRKRKKSKEADTLRERRITKLLFFITLTFIVTYYPYIIVLIVYAVRPEFKDSLSEVGRVFYLMAVRLYLINNVMNAFFYGFFDLEFRNHCKDIYKKLFRKITKSKSKIFVCEKCELHVHQNQYV